MTNSAIERTIDFPIRKCLRFTPLLGLILSTLHVMVGSILVVFILQVIHTKYESNNEKFNNTYEVFMLYKGNDNFLLILSLTLIAVNLIQALSDILVLNAIMTGGRSRFLRMHFIIGILIWIGSLGCFILIFPAGGLVLLVSCLVTTGIRVYILYVIHQFIEQQRKSNDLKQGIT